MEKQFIVPAGLRVLAVWIACLCCSLQVWSVRIEEQDDGLMRDGLVVEKHEAAYKSPGKRDVIVCRGLGDMTEQHFIDLGKVWNRYADKGIITGTSTLLYMITDSGKLEAWHNTERDFLNQKDSAELMTKKYLSPEGMKRLPHVWCDASCCKNCNLPGALLKAMDRPQAFYEESVRIAQKHDWDGFTLDFEGSVPDSSLTTPFFAKWQEHLARHEGRNGQPLELHLWSGSGANEDVLAPHMTSMIDMRAYYYGNEVEGSSSLVQLSQDEGAVSQEGSWRRMRNDQLSLAKSHCNNHAGASLVETKAAVNRSRLFSSGALDREVKTWCDRFKESCGFGLITYDLANAHIGCEEMVAAGASAMESHASSIWIWSGGVIPAHWEAGLQHYTSGSTDIDASRSKCNSKGAAVAFTQASMILGGCGTDDCAFDGNYCCNGMPRRPTL